MIRPIETSEALEATQQQQGTRAVAPATAAGKTFATVLAREKTSTASETENAKAPAHRKAAIEAPQGEVWRPVRGNDDYAKITDGPRAGQYINLSRGERRGEVFRVEERDGKRVHIYGSGENEKVVQAAKDSGKVPGNAPDASVARTPKGEEWAPVKGVSNYADILNGSRNGYYVNTSGGVRDGMAFQVVKDGDRTLHVYGKGKHRQVIEVGTAKAGDKATETKPDQTSTDGVNADGTDGAESTGGTRARD